MTADQIREAIVTVQKAASKALLAEDRDKARLQADMVFFVFAGEIAAQLAELNEWLKNRGF